MECGGRPTTCSPRSARCTSAATAGPPASRRSSSARLERRWPSCSRGGRAHPLPEACSVPAHRRRRLSLTIGGSARYGCTMNAKKQWLAGLQWGACAWLGYVTWHACLDAYHTPLGETLSLLPGHWFIA